MTDDILLAIDNELSRLHQARSILAAGRNAAQPPAPRRQLSARARKAIADAQRKRWARLQSQKQPEPHQEPAAGMSAPA